MPTFGFSGLNKNLNTNFGNNFNTNTAQGLANLIIPVRVLGIILDESHPLFNHYGGWNALGVIQYEVVSQPEVRIFNESDKNIPIAFPANPNLKNYPLINEIVYIISLPNIGVGENSNSVISYYLNLTSLWNHPHHNAYPSNANEPSPPQQKDYLQTTAGSVITTVNDPTKVFLGKTFVERSNIRPLLPFEGDVIHEGRWGNSIRLGSTVQNTNNNWSKAGTNGDPLIIIRNKNNQGTQEGWIPTTEDINNDDSSIYITSTQNIPLNVASPSYVSYPDGQQPTTPKEFTGSQIILDSGRLLFNAYNDHILLSSAKSINLNSKETVNIDTKKFITQADKIFLGKEELAKEPLLLGDTTVQVLKDITSTLKQIAESLQRLQSLPVPPNGAATFPQLLVPMTSVLTTLNSLEKQLGSSPENCTITSKRNFTL
jgi:hypothetical protein